MGVRQTLFEAIYDALTAADLLSSTVTVTAAYIDNDSSAFPQVVVHPIDVSKDDFTFDRSYSTKDIRVMVDIWTIKNKDKDEIADAIDSVLSSTLTSGVSLVGWTEDNALEAPGGNKIHLKTITLNFMQG